MPGALRLPSRWLMQAIHLAPCDQLLTFWGTASLLLQFLLAYIPVRLRQYSACNVDG